MRSQLTLFSCLILLLAQSCAQNSVISQPAVQTYYQTFGQGKPILIINGGPGMNSAGFAGIAKEIATLGYQTIIYDQRGTGNTYLNVIDTNTITLDAMVADLETLRQQLGIRKWTLLGHSFGGILATHYAELHPEQVDKLIFSSSGGVNLRFREGIGARIQAKLTETERDSLDYYQSTQFPEAVRRQKRAEFLAPAYVFDKSHAPAIAERLTQVNLDINSLVFANLEKIHFDYTGKFKHFQKPVLVLQGKNDILTVETAQEIADSFGNARLVLLDNCGHYGWLDAHDSYLSAVQNFLAE